jgi:hypothetical protein
MAFQTGTQVNAALGRTDYTPFLQGALQGAQSQARGGELIGQGLANLGQQVATGIEKYYKKQEEKQLNEQAIDTVSRILKTNPAFGDQIGLKPDSSGNVDRKAIGSVIKVLGGAPNTIQIANTLNEFTRKQTEDTQSAQYAATATEAQGRPFSMLNPVSPTAKFRGEEMAARLENLKSETVKNLREKAGIQGTVMTAEQVAAIPPGIDFKGTPMADGNIYVTGLSRFAPTQPVPEPANPYEPIIAPQLVNLDAAAKAAPRQLEAIDSEIKLLKSGKVNVGFAGRVQQGLSQVRSMLGDKNAAESVTNTQILDSLLGGDLLSAIKSAGLTTKSFDTPAELENLRKALTGSTTLEAPVLEQIALLRKKNIEALVDDYNEKVKSGAYTRMYKVTGQTPTQIKLGGGTSAGEGKVIRVNY